MDLFRYVQINVKVKAGRRVAWRISVDETGLLKRQARLAVDGSVLALV